MTLEEQVAKWAQDKERAHQKALAAAHVLDPSSSRGESADEADDEADFKGSHAACRAYWEAFDKEMFESDFQKKVQRYVLLAGNRYRTDEEHEEALSLLANLRAHTPVSFEPLARERNQEL